MKSLRSLPSNITVSDENKGPGTESDGQGISTTQYVRSNSRDSTHLSENSSEQERMY